MEDFTKKHKKHKKHKKEKSKKKKSSKHSSSESEQEWVEKEIDYSPFNKKESSHIKKEKDVNFSKEYSSKREEWMSFDLDFDSFSRKKEYKKDQDKSKPVEKVGQSSRELNPYWRDGGSGLPPENVKRLDSKVKDQDRTSFTKHYLETKRAIDNENKCKSKQDNANDKPNSRLYGSQKSKLNKNFQKPQYDEDDGSDISHKIKERDRYPEEKKVDSDSSYSFKKGWKKNRDVNKTASDCRKNSSESEYHSKAVPEISPSYEMSLVPQNPTKVLSQDERNMLCAKIFKAELKGNMKLAQELKLQLDTSNKMSDNEKLNNDEKERTVIILTETDSKGFSRPLKKVREEMSSSKRKLTTHEANKRVRYFADDDSLTLSEMFEKERFGSSREQNETFMNLMGKELSGNNEDSFEETASSDNIGKQHRKNWNSAIKSYSKKEKAVDTCYWCIESKSMNQDVIVAVRNQVYLCVPSTQSLTDNHCIIVPSDHIPCATNLDEDVWEDVMSLRKNLVKMFEADGDDVIFFECVTNLDKYPHMQLHCVPVPKEAGDVAPIYFKKAIMECEMEWSNNKKVVELKGRNVRKAVPTGLPYFAVDFGMQPGYAHVIEDKKLFPKNFAQEIIGGMLDIDHFKWRKLHKDSEENIRKKANSLKQLIEKHL